MRPPTPCCPSAPVFSVTKMLTEPNSQSWWEAYWAHVHKTLDNAKCSVSVVLSLCT